MDDFEQFLEMMIDRAKQAERLQKTVPTSDITGVLKHVLAEYLSHHQREASDDSC